MNPRTLRAHAPRAALYTALLVALSACGGGSEDPDTSTATADTTGVSGAPDRKRLLAVNNATAALARWEPLVNLPIVPAAGAQLADGRVLFWSAQSRNNFATNGGHTFTALFNPATNTATERDVRDTGHEMFCPGTSRLPDGRLLVAGGSNANVTSLYDPVTNAWTRGAGMNIPRAYNANTVLSNGSVLTLGGSWNPGGGGKTAEVYTPQTGWRVLGGLPYDPYLLDGSYRSWQSDSHVSLLSTGNGRVLMAGPSPNMAWIDTRGNGSSQSAGRRGDDQPALAQTIVMYDAGKVLKAGGATWNNVGTPASSSAYLIDTTGATAAVKKLAPMAYPRVYANSVVLPNGQVVVLGGQTIVQEFSDSNAVLAPEIWDPQTETFTALPAMATARNYHSIAMLLPDGRVLSAGGGLCGCAADKPNLQIMSPPYLRNADGSPAVRPILSAAPANVGYGTTMKVSADASVTAFSMVRLGAVTHTVNSDQRRVSLAHTRNADGSYDVAVPSNAGILLPGQWMLFAMNAAGTPSLARIVTIKLDEAPSIENPGNLDLGLGTPVNIATVATTRTGSLRYGASGLPAGVTIDPASGRLSGAPTVAGSFLVTLRADNGLQTVSTDLLMTVSTVGTGTGLLGQYHTGRDLGGTPLAQRLEAPDYTWGTLPPAAGVPADNYSVRWTGWIEATASGGTDLRTVSDDGVRLWIDDRLVIDNWTDHGSTEDTATVAMVAGQRYRVTMEYYEAGGDAVARLLWRPAGAAGFVAVPLSRLYPAAAPSTTNLALGRPASQSSTYEVGSAARAVDGNTGGAWSSGSVSHSLFDASAWWQVDLGELRRIDLVQLWNRTDCCSDRLQNFTVFIARTDMSGRSTADLLSDPAVLKRTVGASRVQAVIGIPVYGLGRHVRVQLAGNNFLQLAEVQVFGGPGVFSTPTIAALPNQNTVAGASAELAVAASDPDGNPLSFAASGLPAGLSINADTGRISGIPVNAGSQQVTVTASNGGGKSASTSFTWTVLGPLPAVTAIDAPVATSGNNVSYAPALGSATGVQYSWNFGDGSADTPWAANAPTSHSFAAPGVYTVTLTVRAADGRSSTSRFLQAVVAAGPLAEARASSNLLLETRSGASARLWVVNQDNDSVSVFDTATRSRVAEIAVGAAPRTLARANDGRVWVVNKQAASISVISPVSLSVVQTLNLPRASQPFGIVVAPQDGSVYVALEALGRVLRLDGNSGAERATQAVGDNPRHLALSAAGDRLLVSRYITPPLPGEGTPSVNTGGGFAELLELSPGTLAPLRTLRLAHGNRADSEAQGRGIPNYLGAAAISPDGRSAWVPSKQDNIARGPRRDGKPLDFQNTVRAISSRIDFASGNEDLAGRVDHDNSSVASAALFHPSGAYLFVALETSRQVAVLDAAGKRELFRYEAGLAPQGLAVSADGLTLYVNNLMSRNVSVIDLAPLLRSGTMSGGAVASWPSVGSERLSTNVLKGKQLFYDARDPRLARDSYMSCASCHNDGSHDGRVWDLSAQGEGLRNTVALRGRAGMGHGLLHWSGNFDEVQDFEAQIRGLAGGTGLMNDAQFNSGTRGQPLGDAKAGVSADLDALAAYVGSLGSFAASPWRQADATLSAGALAGRQVYEQKNCASCHGGTTFAGSAGLQDIGTLKPSSGSRLGGALAGIDTPTLRDVWATAPYLHDGSAATLDQAVLAHRGVSLEPVALASLVDYLRQIGADEPASPGAVPTGTGLRGDYFANRTLSGSPALSRTEAVDFAWGQGAPAGGLPADNFSVRWSGQLEAPVAGAYQLQTNSDDGVRVWLNDVLVIDNWSDHAATVDTSANITLTAGQRAAIRVEYYENGGFAVMQLRWRTPGSSNFVTVPANRLIASATGTPAPPPSTSVSASPLFGNNSGGVAFTDTVASGQVLTGVVVRAGWWIDGIQGLASPANLPLRGGAGGGLYTATWPANEWLVRIYGQYSPTGTIGQIAFVTNTGRVLGPYGAALGQNNLVRFDFSVPAGQRVVGFTGRSGQWLHAIGVLYRP